MASVGILLHLEGYKLSCCNKETLLLTCLKLCFSHIIVQLSHPQPLLFACVTKAYPLLLIVCQPIGRNIALIVHTHSF